MEKVLSKAVVARHDPLLSESKSPALSESGSEEFLVDVPTRDWADHIELIDPVASESDHKL